MHRFLRVFILLACAPALGEAEQLHSGVVRPVAVGQVAAADPPALCESAVDSASYANRLPPRLLGAISVTETGRPDPAHRRLRPWPWTINAEGEGYFFETKQAAVTAVQALLARGVASIDVGCMQVNLMHHPHAFASLDAAFDPQTNAEYAAKFLNQLYAESRDWPKAIGAYHSETPALGDAYRVLVLARWQSGGTPAAEAEPGRAYQSGAYRDFAPPQLVYGAFAGSGRVYGAFAPR